MNFEVKTARLDFPTDRGVEGSPMDPLKRLLEKHVSKPEEGVSAVNNGGALSDGINFQSPSLIKVVISDGHPLMLRGIAEVLASEEDIHVVAQATNGNDALKIIRESSPDVAVVDLHLPGMGGLEVIAALQDMKSKTRPVLLASHITQEEFLRAMHLGMRGLILKTMPPSLLVRCVRLVHAGQEFLEKGMFLQAFGKLLRHSNAKNEISRALTRRELGVMELAVKGLSNKQVARELGISEGTVKVHLHRVYEKLRLQGRMRLLHYAQTAGMI